MFQGYILKVMSSKNHIILFLHKYEFYWMTFELSVCYSN